MAPDVLLAVLGVFVTMCVVVGTTTSWALARNAPERRRLRAIGAPSESGVADDRLVDPPDPVLERLSKLLPKSPKEMTKLQRTLTRAGYKTGRAVAVYSLAEIILPLG